MKRFKTWFLRIGVLAIYGLTALFAATLGPVIAKAQCPILVVHCANGKEYGCAGTPVGTYCRYDSACLNGSRCGS